MNKLIDLRLAILLAFCCLVTSCNKEYSNFYADADANGLAILSNQNNNVLSCYLDGKPWRTVARRTASFPPRMFYEVNVTKITTRTIFDTLTIEWSGHYLNTENQFHTLSLSLPIAKGLSYRNFWNLNEKRFVVDSTSTGFFRLTTEQLFNKGNGSIYFQTARIDSTGPNSFTGSFSGIFEANFGQAIIKNGRFDHGLTLGATLFIY